MDSIGPQLIFSVTDRSYFAIIKKEIRALAESLRFSAKRLAELDIVVSEVVTNLVKHGREGQLLCGITRLGKEAGIELMTVDQGPGIADLKTIMQDGATTTATLGLGLGSIKRLSHFFQIYSQPKWGTILLCRLFEKEQDPLKRVRHELGAVVVPKPGEIVSGDRCFSKSKPNLFSLFLGDGLGHGQDAAIAVEQAGKAFAECEEANPVDIIRYINAEVRKTRGLVGTVVVFDYKMRVWRLCGVGNIATRLGGPGLHKQYYSYNGIIGLNVPRTLNTQEVAWNKGQQLIMCSDGIRSRWDQLAHTGIFRYDLSIQSAAIYKDFARRTDDMSVVCCKINP